MAECDSGSSFLAGRMASLRATYGHRIALQADHQPKLGCRWILQPNDQSPGQIVEVGEYDHGVYSLLAQIRMGTCLPTTTTAQEGWPPPTRLEALCSSVGPMPPAASVGPLPSLRRWVAQAAIRALRSCHGRRTERSQSRSSIPTLARRSAGYLE